MRLPRWLRWRTRQELEEEIEAHLDFETQAQIDRGVAPEEARFAARRALGNTALLRESIREGDPFAWLGTALNDARYAIRGLARSPGFAAAAIFSAALGIGANTAIFSLADGTLTRPLDVRRPSEIVRVYATTPRDRFARLSYREYARYRDQNRTLAGLIAEKPQAFSVQVRADELGSYLYGELVSGNFFSMLGAEPVLGRAFLPEEDTPGAKEIVAVLSHRAWESKFHSDPHIAGSHVKLNGQPATIIGVLPTSFGGVDLFMRPEIYVPLNATPRLLPGDGLITDPKRRELLLFGRLKPGVTVSAAQAEFATLAGSMEKVYPKGDRQRSAAVLNEVTGRMQETSDGGILLTLLFGVGLLVLLVACTNIVNLLLGRASARIRELSIRQSIGASRGRLIGQLLTESLVLAMLGTGAGLVAADWAIQSFAAIPFPSDFPVEISTRLDARVLAYTLGVMALSVLLFGLWPAFRATSIDLVSPMKRSSALAGRRRNGLRMALIGGQTALSLVLLITAGLFVKSFVRVSGVNPGFRTENVLLVSFHPGLAGYSEARSRVFYQDVGTRIGALPGVVSAAIGSHIQLGPESTSRTITRGSADESGGEDAISAMENKVGPEFFTTMDTPILRGRALEDRDSEHAALSVVVNETLARRFWPNGEALGQQIRLGGKNGAVLEIVGIARDGKYMEAVEQPRPYFYLPFAQHFQSGMTLFIHTAGDPAAMTAAVRHELKTLAPELPISEFRTMREVVETKGLLLPRLLAQIAAAAGAIGLCLGAVGLYAVIAFVVSRRTKEIGIRMALGASASAVLRSVLGSGVRITLAGIVVGIVGALAVTRYFSVLLGRVNPRDPGIFVGVSALLLGVAVAAAWIPARRAARVDPVVALREE